MITNAAQWDIHRWPNFLPSEFACKCGCGQLKMDEVFLDDLQILRMRLKKPLSISSGYRCPDHNARISSTGRDGPHTTGRAADIRCAGAFAHAVLVEACMSGYFPGIGVNQKGPHEQRFIHLDHLEKEEGPRPWIWSY